MANLTEALKKIPPVHAVGRFLKQRWIDLHALPCLLAERRIKRGDGPIKVGFLCQYIPAWTKLESLYRQMETDPRFEPYLICLPSGIANNRLIDPDSTQNDAYDYCMSHGYTKAINALIGKETWLDLQSLQLQYLFYPRPYNALVPKCYTTQVVSRYCRICLIMYGLEFSEDMTSTSLNRNFMATTYFYFAELPLVEQLNIRNNRVGHMLGLQRTKCCGYPMFEHLLEFRNVPSPSWSFSKNPFRILWTPRWTTELRLGGSNFFTYYQKLLDYAQTHSDIDLLLRPHPLTFPHFIETGEMTEQQVADYIARCEALPNVSLDDAPNYDATLWNTSVMVSDISSIMPEYFITGNPLIFCRSNMILKLAKHSIRMLEGCYIVDNEQELFSCLEMLKSGNDPLKEKRLEIIQEQFGSSFSGACSNIINTLVEDCGK